MTAPSTCPRWWPMLSIVVFLLLTTLFLLGIFHGQLPHTAHSAPQHLDKEWYSLITARGEIVRNQPMVGNCFLCHAYWVPIPVSDQNSSPRFAHANITLQHGSNDRCYNCHHVTDRNKYVANSGEGIMAQTPEKLCARCHGPIYSDWLAGTHGKWTGSWRSAHTGQRTTYGCSECHDPHNPLFRYSIIAPPPVWPEKFIRRQAATAPTGRHDSSLFTGELKEIF